MREFKCLDREVRDFAVVVVGCFELEAKSRLPFVQFLAFEGVFLGSHLAVDPEFEQSLQLELNLLALAFEFLAVLLVPRLA